jgi:hypothetical protein
MCAGEHISTKYEIFIKYFGHIFVRSTYHFPTPNFHSLRKKRRKTYYLLLSFIKGISLVTKISNYNFCWIPFV